MDTRSNMLPDFSKMMQGVPGLQCNAKANPFIYNKSTIIDTSHLPECLLSDVVISAPVDNSTSDQTKRILQTFNADIKSSAFTESAFRGEPIPSGTFMLGVRNQKVELHGPSTKPIARSLTLAPGVKSTIADTHINQGDRLYGENGKFVLNVPAGSYVKAYSGNKPLLYGEGCHVIIDANFKIDGNIKDATIDQSESYINHGTIHILRIPTNKYAKISIGADAFILPGRQKPYVFDSPLFKFTKKNQDNLFYDQTEQYIHHGIIHILRVPAGKLAKIWMGQDAFFLPGRTDPYVVIDAQFKLVARRSDDVFFDQADQYIQHGNRHILRIPHGKYAKIWVGNTALLLFSTDLPVYIDDPIFRLEQKDGQFLFDQTDFYISHGTQHIIRVPDGKIAKVWKGPQALLLEKGEYFFNDPKFRLEINNKNDLFFDATSRLIVHGSVKRVIPHTGEIAITYNNGKLQIIKPNDISMQMINSPTHEVTGFMQTGIETKIFPSEETKKQRSRENDKLSPEEVSLECFTTRDSLKVGVKLLVAYRITDPELALTTLNNEAGILKHIENVATVDMGKAIQQCTSQEFLNSYQNRPEKESDKTESGVVKEKEKPMHYQDWVKKALAKDLAEYGIELVRLNVETPKILDKKIADEMAEASVRSANANAKEATLEQNYRIAQRTAEQEAETDRIKLKQKNQQLILEAEAKLKAADLERQAKVMQAQAEKEAMLQRAEAEAKAIEMRAEAEKKAMDMKGKALMESPALLELEIATVKAKAVGQSHFSVTSPELANMFARNSAGLFANNMRLLPEVNQSNNGVNNEVNESDKDITYTRPKFGRSNMSEVD